ncbi:MAG: hypothetical protein Q8Q29_04105 [Actinomycetota bacterium]|jgi:hypothetical protein|nr:hypothetical protein [Actinomycetota bacterium]
MPRFMMVYKGEATDVSAMPEGEVAAIMAKWGLWMERVGPALVDVGAPFGPGTSVIDDGGTGPAVAASGYSIVEAPDLEAAAALADGHPYLSEGSGNFAIDVYQLMPVPFQP